MSTIYIIIRKNSKLGLKEVVSYLDGSGKDFPCEFATIEEAQAFIKYNIEDAHSNIIDYVIQPIAVDHLTDNNTQQHAH